MDATPPIVEGQESAAEQARAHLAATLIRVGREDRAAFSILYDLTATKLFGICLRICGEREAAEDVLHEVYLAIWKRAGGWEPRGGGKPDKLARDYCTQSSHRLAAFSSGTAARYG